MLSYTFFKRVTDLFLEDVSADSTSEPEGQVQCTKVAFTMEVATRLTAVDNHPMNLVLGFGLKYLKEHFKPWIQDQGGWVCAFCLLWLVQSLRQLEAAHLYRTNTGQMQTKPDCKFFNTACTPAVELLATRHLLWCKLSIYIGPKINRRHLQSVVKYKPAFLAQSLSPPQIAEGWEKYQQTSCLP